MQHPMLLESSGCHTHLIGEILLPVSGLQRAEALVVEGSVNSLKLRAFPSLPDPLSSLSIFHLQGFKGNPNSAYI